MWRGSADQLIAAGKPSRAGDPRVRPGLNSPKEYRDVAAQCLRWAARAKSDEHKRVMLDMAHHWMQTAEKMECAAGPARGSKPLKRTRSPSNIQAD
jgi:hypothetical protein